MKFVTEETMSQLRAIGEMVARSDRFRLDPRKAPPITPEKEPHRYDLIMAALARGDDPVALAERWDTEIGTILVYDAVRRGIMDGQEVSGRALTANAKKPENAKRELLAAAADLAPSEVAIIRYLYLKTFPVARIAKVVQREPHEVAEVIGELKDKGILNPREIKKAGGAGDELADQIEELIDMGLGRREIAVRLHTTLGRVDKIWYRK